MKQRLFETTKSEIGAAHTSAPISLHIFHSILKGFHLVFIHYFAKEFSFSNYTHFDS